MEKYLDKSVPVEERVEDLLSRMTTEEKVLQMTQMHVHSENADKKDELFAKNFGSYLCVLGDEARAVKENAKKNSRLGIPPIFGIDAIHGHAMLREATVYPSQLAMSSSWDRDIIFRVGRETAEEVAADGLDWVFSPVLCIARDTRWGRVGETFGEDQYLIGELGSAIIRGYQADNNVLACAKHYLAYGESTGGRDAYDSPVSERKIREIFLPPFRKASDVGCATYMIGYETADGTPITVSKRLVREILKEECGCEGFVVTDWNNIDSLISNQHVAATHEEAVKRAVEAGVDMSMVTWFFADTLTKLANEGKIDMKYIDDAVRRILKCKFDLGFFDDREPLPKSVIGCDEHRKTNMEITRESLVLLENNGILPLKRKKGMKIAVIGPNTDEIRSQYGDWTYYTHPVKAPDQPKNSHAKTLLDGIRMVYGDDCKIIHANGCDTMSDLDEIKQAVKAAKKADVIILGIGDRVEQNGEHKDRANLFLGGKQNELIEELSKLGKPIIACLISGKPLCIENVKKKCDALICAFNGGDEGGLALAQMINGDFCPSGKLTISFPRIPSQLPVYYNQYTGWHGGKYMDLPPDPLYSFGYGLSYTTFEYGEPVLNKTEAKIGDKITVSVDVTNTGSMDGTEIVQVYVNDLASSVLTPCKGLKQFCRVDLKAGETKTVTLELTDEAFIVVDENAKEIIEPGEFDIYVGPSSLEYKTVRLTLN